MNAKMYLKSEEKQKQCQDHRTDTHLSGINPRASGLDISYSHMHIRMAGVVIPLHLVPDMKNVNGRDIQEGGLYIKQVGGRNLK